MDDCHNICINNNVCEFVNFDFVYFGKGNTWSLAGYGRFQLRRKSGGEGKEEYLFLTKTRNLFLTKTAAF